MMRRYLSVAAVLLALLSLALLGACSDTATLPAPTGAAQAMPTFIFFYTDN
jgi:hypothetical protein